MFGISQNIQQTDENSHKPSKQKESEFSSGAQLKENVSTENLESINGIKNNNI